ncbi:MAG: hypothetical protein AAF845_04515 [Bacteroidota bacterium]
MAFTLRFPTLFSAFRHLGGPVQPAYGGTCPHGDRTTPWRTNTLRGEYRSATCGHDSLQP